MFCIIAVTVITICQVLMGSFFYDAVRHDYRYVRSKSLAVYTEAAKTLLTSSGIAVAIAVAALHGGNFSPPLWMLKRSIIYLISCILSSVAFIVVFARWWERAASRQGGNIDEGQLNWLELTATLLLADAALSSFFLGFLYLARTVYWI